MGSGTVVMRLPIATALFDFLAALNAASRAIQVAQPGGLVRRLGQHPEAFRLNPRGCLRLGVRRPIL